MIPGLVGNASAPMLGKGTSYINSVLGGKYLTGNPYIDKMIAATANDVGNRVNSTFSTAGRTGSYNNVEGLAEGLGNAENSLRYQGYSDERNLQNNAAAMLPGYQQAKTSASQPALAAIQLAGQLPYYGSQSLSGIGSLYGGYGTQTGTQPGGWGNTLGGILGAGLGGWASGGFKL